MRRRLWGRGSGKRVLVTDECNGSGGDERDRPPWSGRFPILGSHFATISLVTELIYRYKTYLAPCPKACLFAVVRWMHWRAEGPVMSVIERNNVHVRGAGERAMVFAHGFGCDQNMWRFVAPGFRERLQDGHVRPCRRRRIGSVGLRPDEIFQPSGYADDVVEIGRELGPEGCRLRRPFGQQHDRRARRSEGARHVRQAGAGRPVARYIDDDDYVGGFSEAQIEELLQFLESNHMGWSAQMAPAIMGNPDRPELGEELTNSFCRTDPDIAKAFARVTFMSDNRDDLAESRSRR